MLPNILVLLLSFMFAGNALAQEPTPSWNIAVLYWSMNIEGQVAMRKGLEAEAEKYNKSHSKKIKITPYVAGDGKEGIRNQVQQFKTAIQSNPDAIIIQPTDNAALSGPLKVANRKKIPVIAYDQYIVDGKLRSFITSNNYQAGELNAEYIMSFYKRTDTIKIVVFEYPKVSSTTDRVEGFFDTLRKAEQNFLVLKTYEAVEPVGGKKAALEFLKDFPVKGSVDVIFSVNDGGGLAVVSELLSAERTEIKQATVDGDPASVQNVVNKKITVIDSAQFCGEIGRQSFLVTADVLNGKKVPAKVLVPTFPITEKTAGKYPGWSGEIPNAFRKPWAKDNKWWMGRVQKSGGLL
ncbi:sugar ABC transporter substrate-binding protein [Bdellovibrio sp. HCB337]|uniref:sugar ABC transporter substrate-binding protein n=1 Tax=Bdellovibrio sp. HCB337 TaxID=3394358 RepID=UPI0039A5C892